MDWHGDFIGWIRCMVHMLFNIYIYLDMTWLTGRLLLNIQHSSNKFIHVTSTFYIGVSPYYIYKVYHEDQITYHIHSQPCLRLKDKWSDIQSDSIFYVLQVTFMHITFQYVLSFVVPLKKRAICPMSFKIGITFGVVRVEGGWITRQWMISNLNSSLINIS